MDKKLQEAKLTVGKVAKRCGVKVSTLHFYEEKGLIRSWRNQGNQRRYKPEVLRRVSVIKAAQKMGISLKEVSDVFSALPKHKAPTKADWQTLSLHWQNKLNLRIERLQKLRDSLTGCIGCGCLSMQRCPIYNQDDYLGETASGPVILERQADIKA